MKKLLYISLFMVPVVLSSCGGGTSAKEKALRDSLEMMKDRLGENDESITGYIAEMNTIYSRLDEIKRNQGVISDNSVANEGDLTDDKREKIQESINTIQQLMDENKAKIDALNKKLKNSGKKNKELEELIANLNNQISEKDKEISGLKDQLANLNIQVTNLTNTRDSLNTVNETNQTTIADQDKELNTVYYCMGSFKELTANKVLDKGGAFTAKSGSKLSADVNLDYFTKVDKRNISEIPCSAKKVTLKTSHPSGSYTLVKEGNKVAKLTINDQTKFWSNSKFCVLMLE